MTAKIIPFPFSRVKRFSHDVEVINVLDAADKLYNERAIRVPKTRMAVCIGSKLDQHEFCTYINTHGKKDIEELSFWNQICWGHFSNNNTMPEKVASSLFKQETYDEYGDSSYYYMYNEYPYLDI